MAISSDPLTSETIGREIVDALASGEADAALHVVEGASAVLNSLIGVVITLIVLSFLVYLYRWAVSREQYDERMRAIEGVTRSAAALFLAINVWVIIRALNVVFHFNYLTVYVGFFLCFMLLCCWSLFNIGESFVKLIHRSVDGIVNGVVAIAQYAFRSSEEITPLTRAVARCAIVVLLGLLLLPFNWWY